VRSSPVLGLDPVDNLVALLEDIMYPPIKCGLLCQSISDSIVSQFQRIGLLDILERNS